jgi:glutamate synthase (NADPH/NADH) small chain
VTEEERKKILRQVTEKQKAGHLKPADRYAIPPQEMPAQDPAKRITNVNEVATEFITAIAEADYKQALTIIKENSLLPAVCGRVCPQEVQCQQTCTVGLKFKDPTKAVSIGRLERFVADRDESKNDVPAVAAETGKKVAVIGSGPGGIVAAADRNTGIQTPKSYCPG